jgi:hypothetical protein
MAVATGMFWSGRRPAIRWVGLLAAVVICCTGATQTVRGPNGSGLGRPLVIAPIDDTELVQLTGNTRPEANASAVVLSLAELLPDRRDEGERLLAPPRPASGKVTLARYVYVNHRQSPHQ